MPALADYLSLIPPQHAQRPRFVATLSALLQPFVDAQAVLADMAESFDLDAAEGAQLDVVGQWVGVSRFVVVPLANVFFSFDAAGLGFDQGSWQGPFDSDTGLTRLGDDPYRTLLRGKIAANDWDGTLAGMAAAYDFTFNDQYGSLFFVQDNQDGSYSINIAGQPLPLVQLALLEGGYLPLRPAGYRLAAVNTVSVPGSALFGFDLSTDQVAGFDVGSWGI